MPPDKKVLSNINSLDQQGGETAKVLVNEPAEEETDNVVTYSADEEGRYYYQPAGKNQTLTSLPTTGNQDSEAQGEDDPMMVDNESYQTVNPVPSDNRQGEVSYVLVVQEETKPVMDINIKDEQVVEEKQAEEDEPAPVPNEKTQGKRKHSLRTFPCNQRFLLKRHMKSHSDGRPHICSVCERGFKTSTSLLNHTNTHNGVKPHVCESCKISFATSGSLVRHIRSKHTHEKPHRCTECDYASVEKSKLLRHIRIHTGERPFQCPNCTYASPDKFKLQRHQRTHTGEKPYKCEHCSMCFTQSNSLKSHKLIHNVAERPMYACELCPAKCGRKVDLRDHIRRMHTSDTPIQCRRCGKSFPDKYSCKIHSKTHEGKCFKCKLCSYASTTVRYLRTHYLTHSDEKPFICNQCDQSFRQKQLLTKHKNIHHNPDYIAKPPKEKTYICHECNQAFAHKGNLIRHVAIHEPDSKQERQENSFKQ